MQIQQLIFSKLQAQGFQPSYDEGDIIFKYEGRLMVVHDNAGDHNYMHLSMPSIHSIESDADLVGCLKIADFLNSTFKLAKFYTYCDNIWISIQLLIDSSSDFNEIFIRSIAVFKVARQTFFEHHQKKAALMDSIRLN
jgi:hypothetical protein